MDGGSWHYTGGSDQDYPPKKRNAKREHGCLRITLQIAETGREAKGKAEKERYTHLNADFQIIARRNKEVSSVISAEK